MDRGDHSRGGSQPRRARWLAPVAAVAGLALSGTALAALPANVATVVGKPISRQEFNHWMVMTARAQPGPLVVAIDPPRFDHCIAQARAGLPSLRHDSTRALRKDCKELFRNVSNVVLDFLISADWHEAEAARDGILITTEQVDRAFAAQRQELFPKPSQFTRFLRRSGQTVADIKFRVRATLVLTALQKAERLSADALDTEMTRRFKSHTACARFYVMSDCGRVAGRA
jgi:hypothetical protein